MTEANRRHYRSMIRVNVTTKASSDCIREDVASDGSVHYRVRVTTSPENGKANEAVLKLVAKELGVAKSRLSIVRGHKAREKTIRIDP